MTSPFQLVEGQSDNQGHPAKVECSCPAPDDQYLLQVDAGTVFLLHAACGRPPSQWLDDAFDLHRIPVTLHWHDGRPVNADDDDSSWGVLTVNGRVVLHRDVPYLVGRDYTDREGGVWHITDQTDEHGRPLVFLHPRGAGEDWPLGQIIDDFGPFTLVPLP